MESTNVVGRRRRPPTHLHDGGWGDKRLDKVDEMFLKHFCYCFKNASSTLSSHSWLSRISLVRFFLAAAGFFFCQESHAECQRHGGRFHVYGYGFMWIYICVYIYILKRTVKYLSSDVIMSSVRARFRSPSIIETPSS